MQNSNRRHSLKSLSLFACIQLALVQAAAAAVVPADIHGHTTGGAARASMASPAGAGVMPSVTDSQTINGLTIKDRSAFLHGISARTVTLGRQLYTELHLAQKASVNHDEISLRLDLNKASKVVDELYTPAEVQALRKQTSIVRADLEQQGKRLHGNLWVPMQAQLEQVRILMPRDRYHAARQALDNGRNAAQRNDRIKARAALDQIEESLTDRYALMPLGTIRSDLRSAVSVIDPYPPYWEGITEATSSALASIKWITTVHAEGWVTAYLTAIEAGNAIPDRPQVARQLLEKTARNLTHGDTRDLSVLAQRLSREPHPSSQAVQGLIGAIGQRVRVL